MDKIFMLKFKNLLKPMMIGFAFKSFAGVINDDELKNVQYSDQHLYLVSKLTIQGEKPLCSEEDCQKLYDVIKLDKAFHSNHTLKDKYDKIKKICNTLPLLEHRDVVLNIVEDHESLIPVCHVIITIVNRKTPNIILNDAITKDYSRFSQIIIPVPKLRNMSCSMSVGQHMNITGKKIPGSRVDLSTSNIRRTGNKINMNLEIVVVPELETPKK